MAPHVLIHPDRGDTVVAVRFIDQHASAFGQDGVVGGGPGDPEALGDAAHGQVADHDRFQCPAQPTSRQLGSWFGGAVGVLTPHVSPLGAAVAAHRDAQRRGSPPERFVGQFGATVSRGTPAAPQRPHHRWSESSDSTTLQARTARFSSSRCPVTTSPNSSRRQQVVRSAQAKPPMRVAPCTSTSFEMSV